MKKNINFECYGYKFKNIAIKQYNNAPYTTMGGIGKVAKQYIQQKYNQKVQIATDSYSGGNSLRVYVSPMECTRSQYELIRQDVNALFSYGSFNGMTDSYEYSNSEHIYSEQDYGSDKITLQFNAKYVFVEYGFKYGTKLYKQYQETRLVQEGGSECK